MSVVGARASGGASSRIWTTDGAFGTQGLVRGPWMKGDGEMGVEGGPEGESLGASHLYLLVVGGTYLWWCKSICRVKDLVV